MKKSHAAKRAFAASVLSVVLCVSLLLGTTYAWFTDSVTSAGNKIIAGTLDIHLYRWNGSAETDKENITETSAPIFGSGATANADSSATLWEPGKTQVAYLSLKNEGTLNLKYSVRISVTNVAKDLYKVMKYKIVPDARYGQVTAWDATGAISIDTVIQTNETAIIPTGSVSVPLAPETEHFFALVIHMDEDAGNAYQAGEVDFDIQVLAAQNTVEYDSFGNEYDASAEWPAVPVIINTVTGSEFTATTAPVSDIIIADNTAISTVNAGTTIAAAVDESGDEIPLTGLTDIDGSLDRHIETTKESDTVTYDISYTYTYTKTTTVGTETTTTSEIVNVTSFSDYVINVLTIGADLKIVNVTHSHGTTVTPMQELTAAQAEAADIEGYYYDHVAGTLTIIAKDYSEFAVQYGGKNPVESIALEPASADLAVGDTIDISASVSPTDATYKTVTWTSSDETVATIENGVVTALSEGTATITAIADGISEDMEVRVFPAGALFISDIKTLQRKIWDVGGYIVLTGDIIFDSPDDFMFKGDSRYCNLMFYNKDVTINLNGHNIRATANAVVEEREEAGDVPKMLLVYKGSLTIVGEGNVVTENTGIAVYSWQNSVVNIYGGNYISNAYERNESTVYTLKSTGHVNVYGGTFMDSTYAFNAHDQETGNVIVLYEGIRFKGFGSLVSSDINHNRIRAAEGCSIVSTVVDDQTIYRVVAAE